MDYLPITDRLLLERLLYWGSHRNLCLDNPLIARDILHDQRTDRANSQYHNLWNLGFGG